MDFPKYPTNQTEAIRYAEQLTRETGKAHTAVHLLAAGIPWAALTDDDVAAYTRDKITMRTIRRFAPDTIITGESSMPHLHPDTLEETGERVYCFTFDAAGEPWDKATFGMITTDGVIDPEALADKAQAVRDSFKDLCY